MTRSEAREQAFKLVFNRMFNKQSTADEIINNMTEAGEYEPNDFSAELFKGVCENVQDIDSLIEKNLVRWKLSRIPKTVLAVLEISVYEILYREDIPDSVSINEAVNLSKVYCSDTDHSFVNGILGTVARNK